MSKELIERAQNIARQLTYNDDTLQAQAKHTLLECAVRIEELERNLAECQEACRTLDGADKERDTLLDDNARLRKALIWVRENVTYSRPMNIRIDKALATTPTEQSLARIRNQVREDIAVMLETNGWLLQAAYEIRAMKEPE